MNKRQIFLAGDSTMADYPSSSFPQKGWGQELSSFFSNEVHIQNKAMNGRSSKSFINEGRLEEIEKKLQPGDYLFIQFGHNDSKPEDARRTDPYSSYQDNLNTFIEAAKSKEAIPVLLTPIQRRKFTEEGTLHQTHGTYPAAMRQFAQTQSVTLIDLTALTSDLLLDLGPERSKQLFMWLNKNESPNFPEGAEDDTHLNQKGARQIAKMVAESIAQQQDPLSKYVQLSNQNNI
ncbi:Lysophospholipase L1 [Halobacillus dabanensis]|uniref:Lysophospholipase L1 n=1 Tax=Halobacillus dabanensis TaxID=240302 RepID=A0A1I3RUD5_HALDA|nr:rhamnogalacturonan acetylesterase [Halobacillus dabanensis]SFJ49978.1 Lysophospholipase L1 [Halobacillus dabanensis]